MTEKVTYEIRVIETDEGFRIELKGDKEELRQMIQGWMQPRFGPFGRPGRPPFQERHHHEDVEKFRRRGRHFFGQRGAGRGYDLGPWWDENPADDAETPSL